MTFKPGAPPHVCRCGRDLVTWAHSPCIAYTRDNAAPHSRTFLSNYEFPRTPFGMFILQPVHTALLFRLVCPPCARFHCVCCGGTQQTPRLLRRDVVSSLMALPWLADNEPTIVGSDIVARGLTLYLANSQHAPPLHYIYLLPPHAATHTRTPLHTMKIAASPKSDIAVSGWEGYQ